jgi:predicted SAM-dependent methyltransferase
MNSITNIIREECVICNKDIEKFFNLENVPITLNCCSSLENFNYETLSFSQCKTCNTIQLNTLIPLDILYGKSHNYNSFGKTWEGYFNLLTHKINKIINSRNVLEIGCPSGKLALNSEKYNKWYIVEPNKNNSVQFNDKIVFIETFFDSNFQINTKIDVIIHSHLFEHIYEPNIFLKKCYELLGDDGEMIFGIPNMQYLSDHDLCLFQGVFFEHTIFMNKENVTYLLNKNGFEIIEIIDYTNHSSIYHVKKHTTISKDFANTEFTITNNFDKFMNCVEKYNLFIRDCNSIISKTDKPVYIFGASYNSQFLLTMGIKIERLTGILDNSKDKQNKYLYGFNLLIYNPELIKNEDCIVILKNSYYVTEIKEQLLNLNRRTQILM